MPVFSRIISIVLRIGEIGCAAVCKPLPLLKYLSIQTTNASHLKGRRRYHR